LSVEIAIGTVINRLRQWTRFMGISILANHAHVFPAAINSSATIDRLLRLLDTCGIDQAVCFAPFAEQTDGSGIDRNTWLAGELKRYDRLFGFGTIDLRRTDVADQVHQVADLGLRGLKIHPNTQKFDVTSPRAMETYAAAEAHKLFITFHTGVHHYRLEHYRVTKFDEIAHHFPNLRFSLEHVGGYSFFNEAIAVIFNNIPFPPIPGRKGHVFGGLTSVFTPDYLRFWYLSPQRLQELLQQAGPEQLIFGLDFPYNLEAQIEQAMETLEEQIPDESARAMVLGGNLRQELGI
jgi:predicted TIM-barrel fold metal-dependent hydrolase